MKESYINRDIAAIRNELIALIPTLTDKWTDFSESDPGMVLIELMSYIADMNNFYIDKFTLEHYLETAIEEKNIRKILLQVDRKPYLSSASSVLMRASIADPLSVPIRIPAGTSFRTANGRNFSIIADVILPAGNNYIDFIAYEGIFVSMNVPIRSLNQQIRTSFKNVAHQGVSFSIDGDYWDVVDNVFYHSDEKVFEYYEDENGSFFIKLSESFKDFIPSTATQATVTVLQTTFYSNSITVGAINTDATISLADGSLTLNFKNISPSVGGAPRESLEQIKKRIPKVVRMADRPVTLQDYRDVFATIPDIAKSSVLDWSVPGGYVDQPYVVLAYVVPRSFSRLNPSDSWDLTTFSQTIISEYIPNISVGVDLRILPPEYLPYNVDIKIRTDINYLEQQSLISDINSFIVDYFSYENIDFGATVNTSLLISEILANFKDVKSVVPTSRCTLYLNSDLSQFIYLANLNVEVDRS